MGIEVTVPVSVEPLSLAEAKMHLRVTGTGDDDLILNLVSAARESAEVFCRRAIARQTLRLTLDAFPLDDWFELPRAAPLKQVTTVSYIDSAGATQALTLGVDVETDATVEPARLRLKFGKAWPATRAVWNAVQVVYEVGWLTVSDPTPRPEGLRQAMRLLLGHWYENREGVVVGTIATVLPQAVKSLLWKWRLLVLP